MKLKKAINIVCAGGWIVAVMLALSGNLLESSIACVALFFLWIGTRLVFPDR